jgi:hypothetical protein
MPDKLKAITTASVKPPEPRKRSGLKALTTDKIAPKAIPGVDPAKRRPAGGKIITTGNIEAVRAAAKKPKPKKA